jgi:thioredoxin reductase
MFEIPVAGAGPAGLAAALTLPLFYMVHCGVEAGSCPTGSLPRATPVS